MVFHVALKRMQSPSWRRLQIVRIFGRIERCQLQAQTSCMGRLNARCISSLKKLLQAFVFETFDQDLKCSLSRVGCQSVTEKTPPGCPGGVFEVLTVS